MPQRLLSPAPSPSPPSALTHFRKSLSSRRFHRSPSAPPHHRLRTATPPGDPQSELHPAQMGFYCGRFSKGKTKKKKKSRPQNWTLVPSPPRPPATTTPRSAHPRKPARGRIADNDVSLRTLPAPFTRSSAARVGGKRAEGLQKTG
ncbi:uncharacterized protein RHO17_007466 isoform 1-T2 [Thomomys bottae]